MFTFVKKRLIALKLPHVQQHNHRRRARLRFTSHRLFNNEHRSNSTIQNLFLSIVRRIKILHDFLEMKRS